MPQLTVRVQAPGGPTLSGSAASVLGKRLQQFTTEEDRALQRAAVTATGVSRGRFHYKRPPTGAQRPGRESTGGRFTRYIEWDANSNTSQVELDLNKLRTNAPIWPVLEIGTGESATMKRGGRPNPQGRPSKGAAYIMSIPSQVGRRIPLGLVFATGPGGQYVSPDPSIRHQQLYLASTVRNLNPRRTRIKIRHEIEGQHFIRDGAETGFRQYRTSVLSAAQQAFRRRP